MKRILVSTMAIAVMLTAGNILAADYSQHSTEKLHEMRGTMQNVSAEEREAFRTEWQKRTQDMTQEDRQKYMGKPEKAGQGKMMKQRDRNQERATIQERDYGTGGGAGMGSGGGMGSGKGGRR